MEKKPKKKLTLSISSNKKSYNVPNYSKNTNKTSVVIEKKSPQQRKFFNKNTNQSRFSTGHHDKSNQKKQDSNIDSRSRTKNFQIRKIAEERATKRFKGLKEEVQPSRKGNLLKNRGSASKREYKLTLSKALDNDAMEGKERSLASVRRARLKEKKSQDSVEKKIELKKIIHEVNIPNKITIQELSNRMAMQASTIIKQLLDMGVVATINHTLDADTAEYLVKEFGNIPIREKKT